MGVDTTYYPVGEDLISDFKASGKRLLYEFMQPYLISIGQLIDKKEPKYAIWEYGQGTRTWNPMIQLLNKITDSGIFNPLLDRTNKIDDESHFVDNKAVAEMWDQLKKLSVQNIEDFAIRPEIRKEISELKGYKMEGIENPDAIVLEFFELYKALFHAYHSRQGLVVLQG
ncbi:MAG: hypothetical protein R2780_09145 [Crocinitomicaceae bacterium]|nr:hypothetical protein [Crocinitomicaceae bacterium]